MNCVNGDGLHGFLHVRDGLAIMCGVRDTDVIGGKHRTIAVDWVSLDTARRAHRAGELGKLVTCDRCCEIVRQRAVEVGF